MASSRRIRPAIASLVSGGSDNRPSSSRLACLLATRSRPAARRCSGASSPSRSRARSTLAPAVTAAWAERRRLASSKFASRLAVARTSFRIRRSSHCSSARCAPRRVSSVAIVSPSRTTTRSAPRTCRALASTSSRRAEPTSASAASGPGHVNSIAAARPGSVSEPWARKAPRITAADSSTLPLTTVGGRPRTGRPWASSNPVRRASASPSRATRTTHVRSRRRPPPLITPSSHSWPKTSPTVRTARRATDSVSSSACTTIRPPTMCSPPAKRNSAESSAARTADLRTCRCESSSLTEAVNAMVVDLLAEYVCCAAGAPAQRCAFMICW